MAKIRVRARTVDMLGRQQIAGIPNAINELFKNAHDAYAGRAEIDFYRSNRLFVLRDDGFGMTLNDFESRWLTLGTDSKTTKQEPSNTPSKNIRPILGEKGIGRLAIAVIGPQVLVLTRAKRRNGLKNLIAAYINWQIFESPGINLSQIEIPIIEFKNGEFPSKQNLKELTQGFKDNIDRLKQDLDKDIYKSILADIKSFDFDPLEIDEYRVDMSLHGENHGTHFIIKPASELLYIDIAGEEGDDRAPPLLKFLLGFTDTMTPDHSEPVIKTAFRDHKYDEEYEDLIQDNVFFTPNEFKNSDHHIQGRFDKYGQFKGAISIYGEEHESHEVEWRQAKGKTTKCGPFHINLAIVQGESAATTIPPQEYGSLITKLNKFGGLYIYKDGIRILPYGDNDFDWLDIERNRTKSAYYYFFSYRRMFGVININHKHNSTLSEKAGREGFRENVAYRQFQSILKNFFLQITADFFRTDSANQTFIEKKEEVQKTYRSLQKREKQTRARKQKLSDSMDIFFDALEKGIIQNKALEIAEKVGKDLDKASKINDPKLAAMKLLELETEARKQLNNLRDSYKITSLRGIGKGKLKKDYLKYQFHYEKLEDSVFREIHELIEQEVSSKAKQARLELNRRIRVEQALDELTGETNKISRIETIDTNKVLVNVSKEVKDATKHSREKIEYTLKSVIADFNRINFDSLSDKEVVATRIKLENRIIKVKDKEIEFLQYLRQQLESVSVDPEGGQPDQIEALEERNYELEERAALDLQLAQLGMAIEVINHEYDSSIRSVRNCLRRLKSWADLNDDLNGLYQDIRGSFDHLDAYLGMFTPLHRRLHRKETEISGSDIHKYIGDLFAVRLKRHEIELTATKEFNNEKIIGYPSTFYPVFVNLVDNAIFWLKSVIAEKRIQFDIKNGGFLITDNGPGINIRDQDEVFEYGFTRKPGGRGMGLYISRQVLHAEGWDITNHQGIGLGGASFLIKETLEDV